MATILIVEDEEPVRKILALILSDAGYRPLQATNGHRALELLQQEAQLPDLIITDVMMPVLNGVQLTQQLKTGEKTKDIPIIMMSAIGPQIADGTGADAFIRKPFSLDNMEQLVRRWLQPKAVNSSQ